MLRKLPDIEIKANSPFEADALYRQEPINILTRLVESTRQPFVLSIEAPWGFGKTTFIKLWKAHLESQHHICLYFNAWENDFVDDPLIAFIGEIKKLLESNLEKTAENDSVKVSWEKVKRIGGGVLRKTLPLAVQIATHGLLSQKAIKDGVEALADDADAIGEFASTLAKERLEKYESEKEGIKGFRESLEEFALEITKGSEKKSPVIFFVDELDRCRPDFAIALLERIKHLFNVKNIVFVLAIDRSQLNQSVKALYGMEANPDGYLRRFIDLAYQLPSPSADTYANNLFSRFAFAEVGHWAGDETDFIRSFTEFSEAFSLSLRTQEQCFTEINIALRTNPAIRHFSSILSFLSTLRAFRSSIFEEIMKNQMQIDQLLGWVSNVNTTYKSWAEAALLVEFSDENKSFAKRLKEIDRLNTPNLVPSGQEIAIEQAKEMRQMINRLEKWKPNVTTCILSLLRLSSGFR